jgi:translation initiation factor eIF-2B subunit epsilon
VHYEPHQKYPPKRKIALGVELFKKHSDLDVRNDLIDCHINICSIEVPALFTENFDYQDIRNDFIRGILGSDILGKQIYCHVLTDTYAVSITNQRLYHAVW